MRPASPRIELPAFGATSDRDAARVLDQRGDAVAVVAEPATPPDRETLRDAAVLAVLEHDFGDLVLAGMAFTPAWGGDAVGFT